MTLRPRKASARRRDTGPPKAVRRLVRNRSGGRCEWPGCTNRADQMHHRVSRGMGSSYGEALAALNVASNLLDCCGLHHRGVTSQHGTRLELAKRWGWVLGRHQQPREVPVLCAHGRVLLDDEGTWKPWKD